MNDIRWIVFLAIVFILVIFAPAIAFLLNQLKDFISEQKLRYYPTKEEYNSEVLIIRGTYFTIKKNSFKNAKWLRKVIIDSNIRTIEESAFENCESLVEIEFRGPDDRRLINIGNKAFKNCPKLIKVPIDSRIEIIGEEAFKGTAIKYHDTARLIGLSSSNLKHIGRNAFDDGIE